MLPKSPQSEVSFDEAGQIFDLVKLRFDLEAIKRGTITATDWKYLKGILCGREVRDIAELCCVQKGTIYNALNKRIKPYLYQLLGRPEPEEEPIDYSRVSKWLIEAHYGIGENQRIDWQQVCRGMLNRQIQSPTLNDLMAKDGICIDPNTLFVPVGLVERKQKQYRRSDIDSAEQGSQLLQPTEEEIVKRFDHEEQFFTQVICNPDIADGARLVITGEPGSGKTTLLQKIGDRLLKAEMFPIWISLGKQGVPPTYEFLSRVLKDIAQPQTVGSSDWDTNINALLQTGKVWLLLDGADELTVNGSPLHVIADQLREAWTNQVKVVLTCRLNAWDTQALPKFQVFRTLEFDYQTPVDDYPNQVEAYIHKFFSREATDSQLVNSLIQQLYRTGKERIRDSVKNPLRLSLLCYVWESKIGELPDTKAELYRLFVDYYYELQERKFAGLRIDRTERDALNLALGEVAKAALDSKDSRFRLRKSLIESVSAMGQSDAKNSLFYKTIQLGWLNYIGTTAEKPHEAAYTFFHPTFQEYFAALAIDHWDHFLPRNHVDKPTMNQSGKYNSYPIFESNWKEVFLLWLGRRDIVDGLKENFLDALVEFEDGYIDSGFYWHRAYFLIAAATAEFSYSRANEIIQCTITAAFGYFNTETQTWQSFLKPISTAASAALHEADREKVIATLIDNFPNNEYESWQAAEMIGSYCNNSLEHIKFLIQLLSNQALLVRYEAAFGLIRVGINNRFLIAELQRILNLNQGFETRLFVSWTLGKVSFRNTIAIDSLEKLLECYHDEKLCLRVAEKLGDIDRDNVIAIKKIIQIYSSKVGWDMYEKIQKILEKIIVNNSDGLAILQDARSFNRRINKRMPDAIYEYLGTNQNEVKRIELSIQQLNDVEELVNLLIEGDSELFEFKTSSMLVRRLIEIASKDIEVVSFLIKTLGNNQYSKIHSSLVHVVGTSPLDNLGVIDALINLLKSSQDKSIYSKIANVLKKSPNQILPILVSRLGNALRSAHTKKTSSRYQSYYEILWHCAQNMSYPDFFDAWHSSFPVNAESSIDNEGTKP